MANHHPSPELLTAFSAGSLQLSHALCVAAHIEHCEECRTNLQRLNAMGAQLFEDLEPSRASDSLKDSVLAKLDDPVVEDAPTAIKRHSRVPRCLQQFIPDDYDTLQWQYVSPSIQSAKLCMDSNGAKVEMLRIKPGGEAATHTHTGDEYTMVLEGAFSDDSGVYGEGDFVVRDGRHKHKPIATKDKVCICLTVTDAPIEFTGFFTRWLNPSIRKSYLPL